MKSKDVDCTGVRLKNELVKIAEKSALSTSQEQLARMVNTNRGTFQGWLKGRKVDDNSLRESVLLGADIYYILTGERSQSLQDEPSSLEDEANSLTVDLFDKVIALRRSCNCEKDLEEYMLGIKALMDISFTKGKRNAGSA